MISKNEKLNSKIKLSNNSSFDILIFAILKFRNIGGSKFCPPPEAASDIFVSSVTDINVHRRPVIRVK